jgi:hypothetical protein
MFSEGCDHLDDDCRNERGLWLHIPNRRPRTLILLGPEAIRYFAHWTGHEPSPCRAGGRPDAAKFCTECREGKGKKPRYVYGVYDPDEATVGLLELPPHTVREINDAKREIGIGRGLAFKFEKIGGKKNSPITAKCLNQILPESRLPACPDVKDLLLKQWNWPKAETLGAPSPSGPSLAPSKGDFRERASAHST